MGESSGAEISAIGSELESFSVATPGGRIQIRWDICHIVGTLQST
jgi:hypothetical protein